ncbi:MAG TPA: lysozyme inhibitor LprI family protein [Gemmatimonadaceae bacterium]|nr:lysozyme inhibitor LprI family protein [Gemmatimonadaceae bacterium]
MANDRPEFTPDLSKLDNRYQILTELNRSGDTRAYLARHLELNRDVVIQVLRLPAGADDASAEHLASDARILSSSRHQHVIPVLDELPIGDGVLAIVRPRVRGTTLDQLISTVGTIPNVRVADTLEQVGSALDWARTQGVVHRYVSPNGVVFQQGSGKVLVSLEPSPALGAKLPNACDDARTLGELAWRMLAGQRAAAARLSSLAAVRPELPKPVIREVDSLMQCDRAGQAPSVGPLVSALDPGRVVVEPPAPRTSAAAPVEAVAAAPLTAPVEGPATTHVAVPVATRPHDDDAVVVVRHGMSFGARLAMAVGIAAVIVVVAVLLLGHRRTAAGRSAAGITPADTLTSATGDVSLHRSEPTVSYDTSAIVHPTSPAKPVVPGTTAGTTTVIAGGTGLIAPPARRPEPLVQNPPIVSLPRSAATDSARPDSARVDTARRGSRDTAQTPATGDVCDSPSASDQRACLSGAIRENDIALNDAYRKVIAALRRQANASDNDPDPQSVDQLRRTEQSWLEWRDATCRSVGSAPLYARERAACFAQESARRTRVLQQKLDSLPQG